MAEIHWELEVEIRAAHTNALRLDRKVPDNLVNLSVTVPTRKTEHVDVGISSNSDDAAN